MEEKDRNTNICVSIVIVCMNNLENLCPCLDSIRKYTSVSCEILVVAYLFSPDNLETVRQKYPWVILIESNEIRGFSENNNLALRRTKGKYCFVLNDDTYMDMPVIDELVKTIEVLSDDVAVVSPKSFFPDGTLQSCGRPIHSFWTTILKSVRLFEEQRCKSRYVNQEGIFETGTVIGAFFLIKAKVFKRIGFFNEKYFFCPEDVELGMKVRALGMKCYVNSDIYIYHTEGSTYKTSKIRAATMPAATQGSLMLYGSNWLKYATLFILFKMEHGLKYLYWKWKTVSKGDHADIMAMSHKNTFESVGMKLSPKEIFKKYYKRLVDK